MYIYLKQFLFDCNSSSKLINSLHPYTYKYTYNKVKTLEFALYFIKIIKIVYNKKNFILY